MALPPGFTYLGAFKVPNIIANTDAETFNWAGDFLAFDPNDGGIFITGIWTGGRIGKIMPVAPSLTTNKNSLPRATTIQAPVPVLNRIPGLPFSDPVLGGLLVDGDSLYGAAWSYYDNRNGQGIKVSHYKFASRNLTSAVTSLSAVGPQSQIPRDVVGGYMGHIPAAHQAAFGASHLTGLAGIAIVSGASSGPAVAAFNASTIGTQPYAPATPLTDYPLATPLANWGTRNDYFNGTTEIKGVCMDANGDVHFFGSHGTGPFDYGGSGDAARADSTTHAPPYRYQIWTYAKADLLAVKNGTKLPHQITPTVYAVPLNFQTSACYAGGMAFDVTTGKMYVAAMRCDGALPIIHVFQLAAAPSDTTPPVITNVAVDAVSETSARFMWLTDELSDTRVEYGTTPSYGTIQVDNVDTTLHVSTLTNLQPGTTYNYRVKSWDAAGNSATSANRTFTTLSPPPPVDPCAAVIAERDALLVQVGSLQADVQSLVSQAAVLDQDILELETELHTANTQNAALQSQVTSLTNIATVLTLERDAALDKIAAGLNEVNQAKAALE